MNEQNDVIPTGFPTLDEALGCGGYPRGRVVEIFGPEGSGKTTLALHAIAECQKVGGTAAFIDAEHAIDVRYASTCGVAPERMLVSQPDNAELALEIIETLVRTGAVNLIVVDSVAALVPRVTTRGEMGDQHLGLQERLMSRALRKLTEVASRTQTCVMFLNPMQASGNALRLYSSMRLDVRRANASGRNVRVKVVKNKLAQPFTTAEFDL